MESTIATGRRPGPPDTFPAAAVRRLRQHMRRGTQFDDAWADVVKTLKPGQSWKRAVPGTEQSALDFFKDRCMEAWHDVQTTDADGFEKLVELAPLEAERHGSRQRVLT